MFIASLPPKPPVMVAIAPQDVHRRDFVWTASIAVKIYWCTGRVNGQKLNVDFEQWLAGLIVTAGWGSQYTAIRQEIIQEAVKAPRILCEPG